MTSHFCTKGLVIYPNLFNIKTEYNQVLISEQHFLWSIHKTLAQIHELILHVFMYRTCHLQCHCVFPKFGQCIVITPNIYLPFGLSMILKRILVRENGTWFCLQNHEPKCEYNCDRFNMINVRLDNHNSISLCRLHSKSVHVVRMQHLWVQYTF